MCDCVCHDSNKCFRHGSHTPTECVCKEWRD